MGLAGVLNRKQPEEKTQVGYSWKSAAFFHQDRNRMTA
jgi:hypothetical protein